MSATEGRQEHSASPLVPVAQNSPSRGRQPGSPAGISGVPRTRTASVWVSLGAGVVVLGVLAVFILENLERVTIHFFGASGTLPVAIALLFAALGGAGLTMAVGAARILQLRQLNRKRARAAKAAGESNPSQPDATPAGPPAEPT